MQRIILLLSTFMLISGCSLAEIVDTPVVCDPETQYYANGECKDNSLQHCGSENNSCENRINWEQGACIHGKCTAIKCKSGMELLDGDCTNQQCQDGHLYRDECEYNDENNCGEHGKKCEIENGDFYCTQDGQCLLRKCNVDYHDNNGSCEPNTAQNCGSHGLSCAIENAQNECIDAACHFTCNKGYHPNGDICEEDSNESCGELGKACSVENGTATCINGECIRKCDINYHLKGTNCEPDSTETCGNSTCNVENANNACVLGECKFTCIEHYHENGNECEIDSVENCGKHGNTCNYLNGTAICNESGNCELNSCDTNYHKYEDTCEMNSIEHCGKHGNACKYPNGTALCSINGTCSLNSCNTNYHQNGESCEIDSESNCGEHGKKCVANQICRNKKCVCPNDGEVLNYYQTACILKTCQNIPGVKKAERCYNNQCFPTICDSGFKLDPPIPDCSTFFSQCIPTCTTDSDCHKLPGHSKVSCSANKYCTPTSDSNCDSGYRKYSLACVPIHNCCGESCQNCAAYGQKCSGSKCVSQ